MLERSWLSNDKHIIKNHTIFHKSTFRRSKFDKNLKCQPLRNLDLWIFFFFHSVTHRSSSTTLFQLFFFKVPIVYSWDVLCYHSISTKSNITKPNLFTVKLCWPFSRRHFFFWWGGNGGKVYLNLKHFQTTYKIRVKWHNSFLKMGRKYCGKRRKFSPFPTMFSKIFHSMAVTSRGGLWRV